MKNSITRLPFELLVIIFVVLLMKMSYGATLHDDGFSIDRVFISDGFSTEDKVEVVVKGYFVNHCYNGLETQFNFDDEIINIKMKALESQKMAEVQNCAEAISPFVETINLGQLDPGNYAVQINGKDIEQGIQVIELPERSSSVKDLAATVQLMSLGDVKWMEGLGVGIEVLGYKVAECYRIDDSLFYNGLDAITINMKIVGQNDFCPRKMTPFKKVVHFNPLLPLLGEVLITLRLDGHIIDNYIVNLSSLEL